MIDSWLVAPMNKRIIFDMPVNERWRAAADSIGIDLTRLVDKQGRV
jgi:putative transcriptional regulator